MTRILRLSIGQEFNYARRHHAAVAHCCLPTWNNHAVRRALSYLVEQIQAQTQQPNVPPIEQFFTERKDHNSTSGVSPTAGTGPSTTIASGSGGPVVTSGPSCNVNELFCQTHRHAPGTALANGKTHASSNENTTTEASLPLPPTTGAGVSIGVVACSEDGRGRISSSSSGALTANGVVPKKANRGTEEDLVAQR